MNLEAFNSYRDKFNLLVKRNGDGGDTAHTTGVYYSILGYMDYQVTSEFARQCLELQHSDLRSGRYVRNPEPTKWWSNVNNFTRDQNNPLCAAMVILSSVVRLRAILNARSARYYFHFNDESGDETEGVRKNFLPDPPTPVEFGLYASIGWFMVPWQYLTDIQLLIDANYSWKKGTDRAAGLTPILLARAKVAPTWMSRLALKCWIRQRDNIMLQIYAYYGEENGNNGLAPMVALFETLFDYLATQNDKLR